MNSTLGCSPILLELNPHSALEFSTYLLLSTSQCVFSHNHFSLISLSDSNAKHIHELILQINSISSAIRVRGTLMDSSSVSSNNPSCPGAMIVCSLFSWRMLTELLWSDPISLANPSASNPIKHLGKKKLCRRDAFLSGVIYLRRRQCIFHLQEGFDTLWISCFLSGSSIKAYTFISTTDSTSVLFYLVCGPLSLHWISQVDEGITTIRSEHLAVALWTGPHSGNALLLGPCLHINVLFSWCPRLRYEGFLYDPSIQGKRDSGKRDSGMRTGCNSWMR